MQQRKPRKRLNPQGYRRLCNLADERDGGCILCGKKYVHHHHVIFRSAGGDDSLDNLVCLCPDCHEKYAHGVESKIWRERFLQYLCSEQIAQWNGERERRSEGYK